jgi:hypothetical protein
MAGMPISMPHIPVSWRECPFRCRIFPFHDGYKIHSIENSILHLTQLFLGLTQVVRRVRSQNTGEKFKFRRYLWYSVDFRRSYPKSNFAIG